MFARKIVKRVNYGFRERELHLEPRDEKKNARIRTMEHFPPFSHSGQNFGWLGFFFLRPNNFMGNLISNDCKVFHNSQNLNSFFRFKIKRSGNHWEAVQGQFYIIYDGDKGGCFLLFCHNRIFKRQPRKNVGCPGLCHILYTTTSRVTSICLNIPWTHILSQHHVLTIVP